MVTAMRFTPTFPRLLLAVVLGLAACSPPREDPNRVVIWHQKTGAERVFFEDVVN